MHRHSKRISTILHIINNQIVIVSLCEEVLKIYISEKPGWHSG